MKHIFPAIFLIVIITTGCKVGKNYSGTTLRSPNGYYFDDTTQTISQVIINTDSVVLDSANELRWWTLFDDPVLDTLIKTGLANNQDAQIAMEAVTQASYMLSIQRREMLPKFDVQGNISRGNYQGIPLGEVTNAISITGNVRWEIDFWGKLRRLNEAAAANYLATQEGLRAVKISLISSIAQTYFRLLEFRKQYKIATQTLATRDSTLRIIQARFDRGIIPEIDVNQAQVQRAIAAEAVPFFTRQIYQTEHALSVLLGNNPGRILVGKPLEEQDFVLDIPAGIPSDLLYRRPDIVAAEQDIVASNALVGVAKAQRLPAISLTGLFGVASTDLSDITGNGAAWNIGGSLLAPLFYWNQNLLRVKFEESSARQAILNYQATAINAFREVEDALIQIETLKQEIIAASQRLDAANNGEFLSFERYDKGVTSYLEYLEQQRQAFNAAQNLAAKQQQLLSTYVLLYKALGGGWNLE